MINNPISDAEIAAADLKAYAHAIMQPNGWKACLAIEKAWELDGYPPAVVTEVLGLIADGKSMDEALEAAIG